MNRLLFSALICLSFAIYVHAQNPKTISSIRFTSTTRAERSELLVRRDTAILVIERQLPDRASVVTRVMLAGDWTRLQECLMDIRLSEIMNLKSPSMNRVFDGAAHSILLITTEDGDTYAHGFDDVDPHERLQPLVRELVRIRSELQ